MASNGDWVHQPETYGGLTTVPPNTYIDLPLTIQPSQLVAAPPLGLGSYAMVRMPTTSSKMLCTMVKGWVVWNVTNDEVALETSSTWWMGVQKLVGDPDDPGNIPLRAASWSPFFYAHKDMTQAYWELMRFRRVLPPGFWDANTQVARDPGWGIIRVSARMRVWLEQDEQLVFTIANQEVTLNPNVSYNFRMYLSTWCIPMV